MSNCDEMLDSAWEALAVSEKWSKTWKAFARRCRGMIVKEMVEMQDTHRQLAGIMQLRHQAILKLFTIGAVGIREEKHRHRHVVGSENHGA